MSRHDRIVILTGAGISAESGLQTFRDRDGIWSAVRIEDVATPEAFRRDPTRVHAFYNARRAQLTDPAVQPNAAHRALARLDAGWRGDLLLVTQNVDDLHARAGSRRLIAMHGQLAEVSCLGCGAVRPWTGPLAVDLACPACAAPGGLRPNVVWFGEVPHALDRIGAALADCDLFVAIGTSGAVYPAAGFVAAARAAGAHTIEINLERSEGSGRFAERRFGRASELVPALVQELLDAV